MSGNKLTGSSSAEQLGKLDIKEGTVEGDEVRFRQTADLGGMEIRFAYRGTVSGDEIKFVREVEGIASESFTAKRVK